MTVASRKGSIRFLRLVEGKSQRAPLTREDLTLPAWRNTLFAGDHPALLVFVNFEVVTESDFLMVLSGRPRWVVDLRRVPRFDIAALNRKSVFSIFTHSNTQYVDFFGDAGMSVDTDRLNPEQVAQYMRRLILLPRSGATRPIVFLVDQPQFQEDYISRLATHIPSPDDNGWDVLRVPQIRIERDVGRLGTKPRRNVVFISHANPEDNSFALWLATHLGCAGYSVWSDLTKLLGGEVLWDSIEEAVRYQAAKVVVVLSRTAQLKQGVLDEINLGVSVERASGLNRFVVPVRIDELEFSEVRANLARKNIIDFYPNWAMGLALLLDVLEQDGVPKANSEGPTRIAEWCRSQLHSHAIVEQTPEPLIANWLIIERLPESFAFYNINLPLDVIEPTIQGLTYPTVRYLRLVGSFAEASDLESSSPTSNVFQERCRISVGRMLEGQSEELPSLDSAEAHKLLTNIVRQAWQGAAIGRGLKPYELASGGIAWFVPKSLMEEDRVRFHDEAGKPRRKQLVGRSDRRQVYWHFAVEARPVLGRIKRVVLRPHVVFSMDGFTPLDSKEKMHSLRRSFCRNWWNDRWRDLLIAFVSWFSDGKATVGLPVGGQSTIDLSASLYKLESPVSIMGEKGGNQVVDGYSEEADDAEALDIADLGPGDDWSADSDTKDEKAEV